MPNYYQTVYDISQTNTTKRLCALILGSKTGGSNVRTVSKASYNAWPSHDKIPAVDLNHGLYKKEQALFAKVVMNSNQQVGH